MVTYSGLNDKSSGDPVPSAEWNDIKDAIVDGTKSIKTASIVPSVASDPGTPVEGEVWYNSTSNELKYHDGTETKIVGSGGQGTVGLPAEAWLMPTSDAALKEQVSGTNYDYVRAIYEDGVSEKLTLKIVMPDEWDGGDLTFTVYWSSPSTTGTHTARWQLQGDRVEAGAAADGTLTLMATLDSDVDGTANAWVKESMGTVTKPSGLAAGDAMILVLTRLGAHANDDLTDDAHFHLLKMNYDKA